MVYSKYLILSLVSLLFGCSSNKRPKVYPDLYSNNLLMEHSIEGALYKKNKIFWLHNFKKVAAYGFVNAKDTVLSIDKTELDMAKSCLSDQYYIKADSIGKSIRLNEGKLKFVDTFYFFDSAFLDEEANKNFQSYKNIHKGDKINEPKINRRSHEH